MFPGTPRVAELEEMYGWVKPHILVPVHGEALHLHEHAALARRLGIRHVIVCEDGDLVRLAPGPPGIIDEIPAARLYKDGKLIIDSQDRTLPERRRLSFGGIVSVALAITRRGDLASDPGIKLLGVPERTAGGQSMADVARDAVWTTYENCPAHGAEKPTRSPRRSGVRYGRLWPPSGAKSQFVTCMCSRYSGGL